MLRISLARVGLGTGPALTGPACLVCGAAPVLMPPLTSVGLLGAAAVLHYLLWVLAPLNLVPLWLGFRHHRNPSALLLGRARRVDGPDRSARAWAVPPTTRRSARPDLVRSTVSHRWRHGGLERQPKLREKMAESVVLRQSAEVKMRRSDAAFLALFRAVYRGRDFPAPAWYWTRAVKFSASGKGHLSGLGRQRRDVRRVVVGEWWRPPSSRRASAELRLTTCSAWPQYRAGCIHCLAASQRVGGASPGHGIRGNGECIQLSSPRRSCVALCPTMEFLKRAPSRVSRYLRRNIRACTPDLSKRQTRAEVVAGWHCYRLRADGSRDSGHRGPRSASASGLRKAWSTTRLSPPRWHSSSWSSAC